MEGDISGLVRSGECEAAGPALSSNRRSSR
jgi:hypothetical protein